MEVRYIDINADMGESTDLWPYDPDKDLRLLGYVNSVNIACGYHAGDPQTMHRLVQEALRRGIAVGAHPSYPDRQHFGRKSMPMDARRIYDLLLYQLGALDAFLKAAGARLNHVKPHGALYNDACTSIEIAGAIASAVFDFDPGLRLVALSNSLLIQAGIHQGLDVTHEVFADRTYQPSGLLTPRTQVDAVITDVQRAAQQVLQMVQTGTVTAVTGSTVAVQADTVCLHSDTPEAVSVAETITSRLLEQHIIMKPLFRSR